MCKTNFTDGTRFACLEDKSVVAIATLLDPRFKKIPFTDICAVEKMKRMIINNAFTLSGN